jgi:FkbM family methyltransferase
MQLTFRSKLLDELVAARFADIEDNFDRMQRGEEPPREPSILRECMTSFKHRIRSANTPSKIVASGRPLLRALAYYVMPKTYFSRYIPEKLVPGEFLYGILDDTKSRTLLIKLMAFRILGHRKIKLPVNNARYWKGIDDALAARTDAEPLPIKFMDTSLAVYDLAPLGYDMSVYASGPGVACAVIQKQYEYHSDTVHCKAEAGDIAIDAGGCWGETSVYFSHEVGSDGKVVAFEFIPSNLAVLKKNLDKNPTLAKRMHLVENPTWSKSGLKLYYVDWGPGSRVTSDINKYHSWEGVVETVTIDEVIARLDLPRVDFIKMDIEGAELDALRGAENSLKTYKPKLAISLYHSLEDFETIPKYLHSLNLGYKFYLNHHTIYENETVLFAVPQDRYV